MIWNGVCKRQCLDGFQDRRAGFEEADAISWEREKSPQVFPDGLYQDSPIPPADGPGIWINRMAAWMMGLWGIGLPR